MFCPKCGAELQDHTKFCSKCGNPVVTGGVAETEAEATSQKKKNGMTKIILLIIILVMVGIVGCCAYYFTHQDSEVTVQAEDDGEEFEILMESAEQCVEDEAYEEAISYFEKALELDENSVKCYIGLADIYLKLGNTAEAIAVLEKGYERTEADQIRIKLDGILADVNEAGESEAEIYTGERTDVNIQIRQVDNSRFPEVAFYASITDANGMVVDNLKNTDFTVQEIDVNGNVLDVGIQDIYQVINGADSRISMNLVLDASGSMDSYSKMTQAKSAANSLLNQMNLAGGDQVEVISFDDYVYLEQDFTSDKTTLTNAINNISLGNMTALYDGLYAGLYQTHFESGVKCVIGFTDGLENASSYSFDDVVTLAQNTGIPVFIIGIGEEYDADELQRLAQLCSGKYYSANVNELQTILEDIYVSIYQEQQDYYVFKYTTTNLDNITGFRHIVLNTSDSAKISGSYTKEYAPQSDVNGAFSSSYMNLDYILDFSSQREVTESDLMGLSLAELRIARNEIFARHGRQFKDSMLNQWFYSKVWYLNIPEKYSPDDFDTNNPSPLSELERNNTTFILNYEKEMMETQDIYPQAANALLSDYDLALSKTVLKTALAQVQTYNQTDILIQNIQRIQEAIDKEDVQY